MALALIMLVSIVGAAPYAYITNGNSDTVSANNTVTNNVTATVPVGHLPVEVAVTPNITLERPTTGS